MILKSIKLTNVRSYIDETIDFPLGVTLFEGDMGSGKSSILMAIEFALFGLGSERGIGLLRIGEKEGSVLLKFEIDGEKHEIFRSLERKGNSVHQGTGYLVSKEGKLQLAPSELKEKILKILNFNEPTDPKARSVIYRYAIFTPQEEMKAILNYRPDIRLQTLRKALMLEDYRNASSNAANIGNFLHKQSIELDGKTSDLDEIKNKMKELKAQIETDGESLEKNEAETKNLNIHLSSYQKELKEYEETKIELSKISGIIPHFQNQIKEKTEYSTEITQEINDLEIEIKDLKRESDPLRKTEKPTDKSLEKIDEEISNLDQKEREFLKKENLLKNKISEYELIEKNKSCPTCDRPIESEQFLDKIEEKSIEKIEIEKKHAKCLKAIEEMKKIKSDLKEFESAIEKIQEYDKQIKKDEIEIENRKDKITRFCDEIKRLSEDLESAKTKIEELTEISNKIKDLESKISDFNERLGIFREKTTELKTKIHEANKSLEEYRKKMNEKEKQRKQAELLRDYRIWIDDYFIPTVEVIEKHALISINSEFDKQYRKWYDLMIEDSSKESRIDEEFSPIIEQDGYEQNMDFLSGGEKTSVALAYRLALNNIVQKVSIGMKSNLLILDEPTDGFSKSQLFKMREIIDEIKCPQLIMVSHERELENFADHVLRIDKSRGISRIISM